ncbi:MAG: HAMP domain-containing sensor histidine kinase [Polaromonas sp.]|nr:HAMP domain-containing sensor histidine kinase [Polaromonas sp.]
MKLSQYITDHTEEILAAWDSFAQTLEPAASGMTQQALRDHARQMLTAIALDIDTIQNESDGVQKSLGHAPETFPQSAASIHGTLREDSGFTLVQLTAEFRALRASVLRLWLAEVVTFDKKVTTDIVRFNEAIDQALAESAVTFSDRGAETRDRFLAILGHDLRTPVSAVSMAGQLLVRSPDDASRNVIIGERLRRSAATMTAMVSDLLEYSRKRLGGAMPHVPEAGDMGEIVQAAVHDSRLANPDCDFDLQLQGDLNGRFDRVRMQQVVTNLLANAAQYRAPATRVAVDVAGEDGKLLVVVRNLGRPIPAESIKTIFSALVQLPMEGDAAGRPSTSMGLGLYVAREIAVAHGGSIDVTSGAPQGTVFTVTIPRGTQVAS